MIGTGHAVAEPMDIMRELIDAGVRKADVDRRWKRLQPVLRLHPQVRLASNRYVWSAGDRPPRSSLDVLAGQLPAKVPGWLAQALIENVSRGLAGPAEPSRGPVAGGASARGGGLTPRGRKNQAYYAYVLPDGRLKTSSGVVAAAPTAAMMAALGVGGNGWSFWCVERTGERLDTVRQRYLELSEQNT